MEPEVGNASTMVNIGPGGAESSALKVNVVLLEPPTPVVKVETGEDSKFAEFVQSTDALFSSTLKQPVIPGGKNGVFTVRVPGSFPFVAFTVIATDSEFSPALNGDKNC